MANEDRPSESGFLSAKDMQNWALQEITDSAKAHELRSASATEIATAYALGELTPQQAHERFVEHNERWGEALPGTHNFKGSTDERILASIDKVRAASPGFGERFGSRDRGGSGQKRA